MGVKPTHFLGKARRREHGRRAAWWAVGEVPVEGSANGRWERQMREGERRVTCGLYQLVVGIEDGI